MCGRNISEDITVSPGVYGKNGQEFLRIACIGALSHRFLWYNSTTSNDVQVKENNSRSKLVALLHLRPDDLGIELRLIKHASEGPPIPLDLSEAELVDLINRHLPVNAWDKKYFIKAVKAPHNYVLSNYGDDDLLNESE